MKIDIDLALLILNFILEVRINIREIEEKQLDKFKVNIIKLLGYDIEGSEEIFLSVKKKGNKEKSQNGKFLKF